MSNRGVQYPVDPHSQVDFKDPVQNSISVGALGFT